MEIEKTYDLKLKTNLEKRLNRSAFPNEIINADKDSDLVNETLWQIIVEMEQRIISLEKNMVK